MISLFETSLSSQKDSKKIQRSKEVERNYFICYKSSVRQQIYCKYFFFSKVIISSLDVENVLIVVGIEQYNPLSKFEATHFRVIVERAKVLQKFKN